MHKAIQTILNALGNTALHIMPLAVSLVKGRYDKTGVIIYGGGDGYTNKLLLQLLTDTLQSPPECRGSLKRIPHPKFQDTGLLSIKKFTSYLYHIHHLS